ncbi:uncharacterized protein MELLADRAFT_76385 [Melampsora larici-populina 98AG31]|uniref:Uncharacterized protein n=1 Tax=Melampsora larici-populina (strain 98AG31 / pathotype 3-4-7) TaxID=747676 RepID=F4R4Q2_MELLP|nr:uncharacterized protein MELLADRAFT_76385 [Melampsora larici-populina 98AG31]EGG12959.1 hypothetical protein MELLADRAFT_76385 [Melampsora larici-populina 98AG31]
MSSNNSNDQSIWEILDALESKMIDSFHSTSDLLMPQIIETSNQLYTQIESISKQAYEKSIELGSKSDLLSNILSTSTNESPIIKTNNPMMSNPDLQSQPSILNRIFKPKNLIITAGVWFTSTLALRLLVSSDSFQHFLQDHPNLRSTLPRILRTRRKKTSHIIRPRYSTGGKTRLEAIIVLCADPGTIGSQLAIELASVGYIVIASVSDPVHVSSLERDGLGWIKALVLDPTRPELAPAFTRSLASALSLRFPLHSAGDAFMGDGSHSALVGMVNCFPISNLDELRPVETMEPTTELIPHLASTVGISLEVVKVVLPMMRNSIEKSGGEDGVILTLFPTKTSSVALPYLSSSVIVNQALETLMTTLRREILICDSPSKQQIRIINERIGLFKPPSHFPRTISALPTLPAHLHPIYAPSLSRRLGFLAIPTSSLSVHSLNGTPLSNLFQRVKNILQSPSINHGSFTSTGKQVMIYKTIGSFIPDSLIELWLRIVERMNGWVRRKVSNEIDLESSETLEQVIGKRDFSLGSGWKNKVFNGIGVEKEIEEIVEAPAVVETTEVVEAPEVVETPETVEPSAPSAPSEAPEAAEETAPEPTPDEPAPAEPAPVETEESPSDTNLETGSCVDKGETTEEMQESFVGSEIDWKAEEKEPSSDETKVEEEQK